MSLRSRSCGRVLFALLLFVGLSSSAVLAQEAPTPKFDIFGGYSWYDPGLRVNNIKLESDPKGFAFAPTYNFSKNFGISVDGAGHFGSDGLGQNQAGSIMVGPRFMLRNDEHFWPF